MAMLISNMKILIVTQGWYGERILQHLLVKRHENWEIDSIRMPRNLPQIIDEPEGFLPNEIGRCQLLIALSESPGMSSLIPHLAVTSGAAAVVAPIDNPEWLPPGLRSTVLESLLGNGIAIAFPKPFCTLEEKTGNRLIDEFASRFGKPKLEVSVGEGGKVKEIKVVRGSPCGSTDYVAEKLLDLGKEEAELRAGLLLHGYPCLASMEKDQEYGDTLLHISGYMIKDIVRRAFER